MNRRVSFFLTICLIAASTPVICSQQAGEIRGMWVDAWGVGLKSPEQVTAMVSFAEKYGFTDLFVQVRKRGDAYYDSAFEPRAPELPKGFDPLKDVLAEAHAKGMKIHAWLMVYDVWSEEIKEPPPAGHVSLLHPDWLTQNDKGKKAYVGGRMYLDPGVPEVADHVKKVVEDIARKYKVDGIHLDGMRYCDDSYGYDPRSVALFNAEYKREGIPAPEDREWGDWRREQVTKLAKELPPIIRKIRPSVKVSNAVYYNLSDIRLRFFQDWPRWGKERDYDFLVPMAFVPKDVPAFIRMVDEEMKNAAPTPCLIGQGTWRFPTSTTNRHLRVIRGRGAMGFVLFDYGALSAKFKDGTCRADTIKVRP